MGTGVEESSCCHDLCHAMLQKVQESNSGPRSTFLVGCVVTPSTSSVRHCKLAFTWWQVLLVWGREVWGHR